MKSLWMVLAVGVLGSFLLVSGGCQAPKQCIDGDSYRFQGKLEEAVDSYEACLPELTNENQRGPYVAKIAELKDKIVSQTMAKATKALGLGQTLQEYDRAISLLNQKLKYDDAASTLTGAHHRYQQRLSELKETVRSLGGQARQQIASQQWNAAGASLREALLIDPASESLQGERASLIQTRDAHYTRQITEACDQEDHVRGQALLSEFSGMDPAPARHVLDQARTMVVDTRERVIRRQAEAFVDEQKYFSAYTLITETGVEKCVDLMRRIKREGSEFYKNLAYKEKANVKDFYAYIAATKAKIMNPDDGDIFELHRDCQDRVDEALQMKIAIAAFDSPSNEPDAGRELADALISTLSKAVAYGVSLDERERLDFAIQKQGLDEGILLVGCDYAVFGNLSTLTVTTRKQNEREKTTKVQVGTEETPNPEYERLMRLHGPDMNSWPTRPPATLKKEISELVKYRVFEQVMEGMMVVSPRLYSRSSGSIVESKTFTVQRNIKDTFQEEVAGAGVQERLIEMPMTELEMKQDLKKEMVGKVTEWIRGSFEPRQKHLYEQAERHIDRREFDLAVEALAKGYLYCRRDKVAADDVWWLKTRQKVLFELTE